MKVIWLLIGIMMAQFVVLAADADTTVYEWTNRDNSICYTDDVKRVPKAYADTARSFMVTGLKDYSKYTHVGTPEINVE